jgi:hypothetical protein
MRIKYGDYSYEDDNWKNIAYDSEPKTPYYGPEEERFQFPTQNKYYLVGSKTKKKSNKPKAIDEKDQKPSNEKIYIGMLIGSTALFLMTLFYFLFVQNKKK